MAVANVMGKRDYGSSKSAKQLAKPDMQPEKTGYSGGSDRLAELIGTTMSLLNILFDKIELMFKLKKKRTGWTLSLRLSLG